MRRPGRQASQCGIHQLQGAGIVSGRHHATSLRNLAQNRVDAGLLPQIMGSRHGAELRLGARKQLSRLLRTAFANSFSRGNQGLAGGVLPGRARFSGGSRCVFTLRRRRRRTSLAGRRRCFWRGHAARTGRVPGGRRWLRQRGAGQGCKEVEQDEFVPASHTFLRESSRPAAGTRGGGTERSGFPLARRSMPREGERQRGP